MTAVPNPMESIERASPETRPLDVGALYAQHAQFVWKTLHRLGVQSADLEDMVHEVFMIVQRRLDSFDGSSRVTTWLFGITMRVASGYRRTLRNRREAPWDPSETAELRAPGSSPETVVAAKEARVRLDRILDAMEMDKRAVFVLFELDQLPCGEIAALMGVPVGTVYSRLHAARQQFDAELKKLDGARGGGAP